MGEKVMIMNILIRFPRPDLNVHINNGDKFMENI